MASVVSFCALVQIGMALQLRLRQAA
jgi:hypothetical protein